jgi:hypothetical protein
MCHVIVQEIEEFVLSLDCSLVVVARKSGADLLSALVGWALVSAEMGAAEMQSSDARAWGMESQEAL